MGQKLSSKLLFISPPMLMDFTNFIHHKVV